MWSTEFWREIVRSAPKSCARHPIMNCQRMRTEQQCSTHSIKKEVMDIVVLDVVSADPAEVPFSYIKVYI